MSVAARKTDARTLKCVLHAIRDRQCVEVEYVSLSSESEGPRQLYPHAIASDGHRWHMRAFDADKERFSDFVLSQIEKIKIKDTTPPDVPEDKIWQSFLYLTLEPDPTLKKRQKEILHIEYDMKGGRLSINVRQAMLFYYLRSYGFNPHEKENGMTRNKSSFSLRVVNLEEVERCLERRS